jgi:hypothetical protein
MQIYGASVRALKVFRVSVRADKNDAVVFDGNRFGLRSFGVGGVNVAIYEYDRGRVGRARRRSQTE